MNEDAVVDRNEISVEKRELIDAVVEHFSIEATGLCILLDDNDHEGYPNRRYADRAFYMDIVDGGIEEMSPDYVLEAMLSPTCRHFIWMSRRACLDSLAGFTWILAHEIQHLVQRASDKLVAQINGLLWRAYPGVGQPGSLQIDFPAEFDAELSARDAVRALLGEHALERHLAVQRQTDAGRRYFERFREIERKWSGDLRTETLRVLCSHKADYSRVMDSLGVLEFTFDIEQLCSESAHMLG